MLIRLLQLGLILGTAIATFGGDVVVAADGSGNFRSVQQAVDSVPENNRTRIIIRIKPGTYREQIRVPASKPFISFLGENGAKTVLTFNLSNKDVGSTSASYSVYIGGHDFRAENITFENSFGIGSQAVAVLAEGDRAVFIKCRFLGWQDTLYAKNGRQYYHDCYIEGNVDFIFGQAAAVFDRCEIHSKGDGYIAAPMRFGANEPAGLIFVDSRLTASDTKEGVYLGRPWREFGRVVFLDTEMGGHIRPEGWHHWLPEREKTAFMAEYKSRGDGARTSSRASWSRQLTDAEAKAFAAGTFLAGKDGWQPTTANDAWLEKTVPDGKLVAWGDVLKQPSLWYQTDEAARIADQVILYQKVNGGWEKNIEMAAMLTRAERDELTARQKDIAETTIDNKATYTQIEFLAKVITASLLKPSPPTNLPKYRSAFDRGVDHLLSAQYPNGGFPQYFPLKKGYYTHITFNDDAMIGVLRVLRDIARKDDDYRFVDAARRAKAETAVSRGVSLILKLQVEIAGKKTVWAPQYDEVTLKPAWARKFEPPCLTAGESVGIVRFLMQEKPTPEITAAIESAVTWFRANEIRGIRWERKDGQNFAVKDAKAGQLWARFYEIESMKPIFLGRDSVIRYDVMEIEAERRNGYAWYVESPRDLLAKDYPKWKSRPQTQ